MRIFNRLHGFMWHSMTENNCNTYLIDGPTRVIIDPGHRHLFGHVQKGLTELGLDLEDIGLVICTHAHPDHFEAVQFFKEKSILTTLHAVEWKLLKTMGKHLRPSGISLDPIAPDFFLKEGDLSIRGLDLKVYHTPGHTPGSVSLYWPEHKALFSGDLIFKEGLGRTDLPGGDGSILKESIRRLSELDIKWILPGHGDIISGTRDVKKNFDHLIQYWFKFI